MDRVDVVVVGAGVVGLATARALAMRGREVLVLEAAEAFGTGVSSRSSEVIHAGLYYPAGSLKARLCRQGRAQLYAYCDARGIAHRRCGKLIVATETAQLELLQRFQACAAVQGIDELRWLSAAQAQALEPQLRCVAALHSPGTGIVDSHALMLALLGDLQRDGGQLVTRTPVRRLVARPGEGWRVYTADGTALQAHTVVNAAGLQALALARHTESLAPAQLPPAYFAKGSYFTLDGAAPFRRLIYPLPEPGGLGVHLTLDLGGQARFGPDVEWVDSAEDLQVDARRADAFYAAVRRYWPGLRDGALRPAYAGIRPKIAGPGMPAADFWVQGPREHGAAGLVHLLGIESPGLTSALALADEVLARLDAA